MGERGGRFKHLTAAHPDLSESRRIFAGKFRRYHEESWLKQLIDIRTNLLNLRDAFFVAVGCVQSVWLMLKKRPDVVFIKGGFVGVPIGLAAALCRVPFVTHDSDTTPGLANRIIARWARLHATGMPTGFYSYPADKTRFTGVPLAEQFTKVTPAAQQTARRLLNLPQNAEVILVTGGSLGSRRINHIVKQIIPELLAARNNLYVIHQVGQGNENLYADYTHPRLQSMPFIEKPYDASAAANVIITRGSATTIAGLAVQAKPIIVIPSPFLAGGHQLKNAEHLEAQKAAVVLSEKELLKHPALLSKSLENLLDHPEERRQLSEALTKLGKADAAKALAELLLEVA